MDNADLNKEQVLDLVIPSAIRDGIPQGGAHSDRALRGLLEFGFVQRDSDGLHNAKRMTGPTDFMRQLRHQLVMPAQSPGREVGGAPDLRQGLVWLMRQVPTQPLHWQDVETSMPEGLFTNDTRWNGFRWWSQALGFSQSALTIMVLGAKQSDKKGSKIVADPTEAVIDVISHPVGPPPPIGEQIPIQQFLDFLRGELPVLPGHPSATYEGLDEKTDTGMRALGLALSCAEARGVLVMTYQSDPSGVLGLPDAREHGRDRYISAVTIKG